MSTPFNKVAAILLSGLLVTMAMEASAQPLGTPPVVPLQPATGTKTDEAYVIGPDDTIEVDLLGQPEFKTRTKIKTDGTMPLPFIGSVHVAGQTSTQLAGFIANRLREGGYYAKPVINVEIVGYASRYVIVLGDVAQPGMQPVDRAYRVSEIIARAGGMRESGADYVVVTRPDGSEMKLPFRKLASGGGADDPFIQPGDKVFVPPAEMYYIYGQVNGPGAFPLKDQGMTMRMALAKSGGLTASGSEKRIKIFHDGKPQKVDLERIIQPGDVIVVGERFF